MQEAWSRSLLNMKTKKIEWQEAEARFVSTMQKQPGVVSVEHISLYAQNSEWDVMVLWDSGEKWYVDVTTGIRKKFNKPKVPGRFFLAFTTNGKEFDLFEIIHRTIY